ncbi:MAG TPA: hypothetical protein VM513_16950 [Kofleriaceae bacterium]|nr:hypothetical protein [Kofleriaceae bacterium]
MLPSWSRLIAVGATLLVAIHAREARASCIPGFDYAAFGKDSLRLGGGTDTDSFNSSLGDYASTQSSTSGGNLGTNGTGCPVVDLNGGSTSIGGNIESPAMTTCTVDEGAATVHGTESTMPAPVSLPSVIIPTIIGTDQGDVTVNTNRTWSATPNNTWRSVEVRNGNVLTLNAGTYVLDNLYVKGEIRVNGAVAIYLKCSVNTQAITMDAGALLNNVTPIKPSNLIFFLGPSCATASMRGGSNAGFAVYAPDTAITLNGNDDLYGAIVGKTVSAMGGINIHYDRALADFASGDYTCPAVEISRAAPVVATVGGSQAVVQGTFEAPSGTPSEITTTASVSTWTFPYLRGHMRARVASSITTSASTFSSGTILFDAGAAGRIPTRTYGGCSALDGSCRNVFTVTSTPGATGVQFHPTKVQLNDSNASTIGALIAPAATVPGIGASEWQTIVRKVLDAPLGGVDRSTVAVIEPSPLVSGANGARPTIAYFGGADGMLHAVCASTGGNTATQTGVCPSLGTELWAFIPRTQLPLIRNNTARVDGSVRVIDAFGDFVNNPANGTKSWRTILVFQTGFTNDAYAIDVSDPASPVILWEYSTPASPGTTDLGAGMTVATGSVKINGKATNLAVLQTNNGASTAEGVVAKAVSLETGAVQWSFGYLYPNPARTISADLLPVNGIPGGAVPVDLLGSGFVTDFAMGDLYGNLWRLNAADGTSRNGTGTPLFSFSANKKPIGSPPAIYNSGGAQYAAFGSGGYTHPTLTGWAQGTQYLLAIKLNWTGATIDETGSACTNCAIGVKVALSTNHKAFSQALVVGTSLVLTTDVSEVNSSSYGLSSANTGELTKVDLTGAQSPTILSIASGATAVANAGTTLYSSSSSKQQQLSTSGTSGGTSVDVVAANADVKRALWLRTE